MGSPANRSKCTVAPRKELWPLGKPRPKRLCIIEGYGKSHVGRGSCRRHFDQYRGGIIDGKGQGLRDFLHRSKYKPPKPCALLNQKAALPMSKVPLAQHVSDVVPLAP